MPFSVFLKFYTISKNQADQLCFGISKLLTVKVFPIVVEVQNVSLDMLYIIY